MFYLQSYMYTVFPDVVDISVICNGHEKFGQKLYILKNTDASNSRRNKTKFLKNLSN